MCCSSWQLCVFPFLFLLSLLEGSGRRQRGDSKPCGQSPMDFESISLAARTHCLGRAAVLRPVAMKDKASPRRAQESKCKQSRAGRLGHESAYLLSARDVLSMRSLLPPSAAARLLPPLLALPPGELWKATARGFEPLRAEPNGFRVHLLSRSDTLS